jgi:hypothetical protein
MDIVYRTNDDILEIRPLGPLEADDFKELSERIRRLEERDIEIKGILIISKEFPSHSRLTDWIAHGEFIKNNRNRVGKIAIATDSKVASVLELIGRHLASIPVKHFAFGDEAAATKWLSN